MEVVILASGSKGNATIIKMFERYILVDVGISYNILKNKVKELNVSLEDIKDVLITHEHLDHIKGLKTLTKNYQELNVYLTKGTYDFLEEDIKNNGVNFVIIKDYQSFIIDEFNIHSFPLSHDANEPCGYLVSGNNKSVVFATDTGYIDREYYQLLSNANLYILEANHEPSLLMDSKRPYYLKQRILSDKGHLSNNEASYLINEFIKEIDESIWAISHISEDCNTNYFIEKSIVKIIEDPLKLKVIYTSQKTTEVIKL